MALLFNSAYIWAFHPPTAFYMGNVLLHLGLGVVLAALAAVMIKRTPVLGCFLAAALAGVYLAVAGNTRNHQAVLWLHILLGVSAVVVLIPWIRLRSMAMQRAFAGAFVLLLIVPASAYLYRRTFPNPDDRIQNPHVVPTSMDEEGGGPKSPFFPSSIQTNTGKTISSEFFMDSKGCGECHQDAYKQWNSSAHHFASFNNQFYRKSIEYMQDVSGTQSSKWCAGCHDHALLLNGRWEKPVKEQIDTPEAQNGLGCMSCHSIAKVDSSMGNAGFTMNFPPLHELANSKNKYIRSVNHFLTYLSPEPHRKTFMKPFMRQDSAEFCASCHKVHLDVPGK